MIGFQQEKREVKSPSPRSAERRQQQVLGKLTASGGGANTASNSLAVLGKTTTTSPADLNSYSPTATGIQQIIWPENRSGAPPQLSSPEPSSFNRDLRSSSVVTSGQIDSRQATTEQRTLSDRLLKSVIIKAPAAAGQESDKFRALERLNYLAGRLRQQPPPTSAGDSSAGQAAVGGRGDQAVQPPPRSHQQQPKVKLKGLGSKSDSDSGFGGDASSTGTADSKIKQVRTTHTFHGIINARREC